MGVLILILLNSVTACESTHPSEVVAPGNDDGQNTGDVLSPQEQLAVLNQKAAALTSQPGWVYVRSIVIYDTDRKNIGVLANGQEIPLSQINEDWFHINEAGLVFESVSTMSASDGEIIQTSVYANGFSWNSATDERVPKSPYLLGDMSGDLASLIQEMIERTGQMPGMVITEAESGKVYTFTVTYTPAEPIKGPDFDQPVTAIITVVSINDETGLPVQHDQIMVLEDGTQRAFYRVSNEIQIGAMPPESIISIIEERK